MDEWIGRVVEGTVHRLGAVQAVVRTGVCSEWPDPRADIGDTPNMFTRCRFGALVVQLN